MCFKYIKICLVCKTSYELRNSTINKCGYQYCDMVYLKPIYIHECKKCIPDLMY